MAGTVLKIEGMSCQHCVQHVKKAVDGVNGVSSSEVSVGSASVEYDETKTTRDIIEEAVIKAGYKITG